ncbi:MAG TPA: hypothetical protein VEH76_10020 [Methylocystis sp.]|nr:hypothetical protein [Methylocystis sp.]
MAADGRVIFAQNRLDAARRELRQAVIDFDVTDEKLLELRAVARQAFSELRELDHKNLKAGFLELFKFW